MQLIVLKLYLEKTENKLEELERKRNEVSNIVDNMDSDDVSPTLSQTISKGEVRDNR